MLDGPRRQLRARVQPQFGKYVAHVRIRGARRNHELFGDLAIGVSASNQSYHLALAWAERVHLPLSGFQRLLVRPLVI